MFYCMTVKCIFVCMLYKIFYNCIWYNKGHKNQNHHIVIVSIKAHSTVINMKQNEDDWGFLAAEQCGDGFIEHEEFIILYCFLLNRLYHQFIKYFNSSDNLCNNVHATWFHLWQHPWQPA